MFTDSLDSINRRCCFGVYHNYLIFYWWIETCRWLHFINNTINTSISTLKIKISWVNRSNKYRVYHEVPTKPEIEEIVIWKAINGERKNQLTAQKFYSLNRINALMIWFSTTITRDLDKGHLLYGITLALTITDCHIWL